MALPVLDGNQSATTLSSVVTGGEHIVAHSVVSLGTTAIANITSAVSGVNIGGTVTANINGTPTVTIPQLNKVIASVATDGVADATTNFVKIGGHQDGQNQISHIVHVSAGGAMKVDASDSSVTFGAVLGTVTISNFPSTQTIAGTVTANLGSPSQQELENITQEAQIISGKLNSVTIGSLPAISGTVTANLPQAETWAGIYDSGNDCIKIELANLNGNTLSPSNPLPISGTVTVGNSVTISSLPAISGTVTAFGYNRTDNVLETIPIKTGNNDTRYLPIGPSGDPDDIVPISGTVTAAAPNGSLTTRFGTPTTANVSFATSAVTNANRKYLLIQNVTTGSNVITVGVGFTPTTTQGIQLTAGAGITFESSYIPTGAVYVLSSVTASNFTILEA